MYIMSKTSNIIAKIKELFAEEKMSSDYTAATGQIIRLEEGIKIGSKVQQVIGGVATEIPDGNYLLDEGKSIVVSAGSITEINQPKATSGEPNQIEMAEEGLEGTCWEGYEAIGTKMVDGKEVPNCVPIKEEMGDMKDKMEDEYKNEVMSKLEDGTEVKIMSKGEALSIGDMVLVKDAEGEFKKAPEGEHKLEGGLTISTDAEGFINELETEESLEEEEVENEEMKTMFEVVSTIKSVVDELRSTLADLKTENKELKERFNKFAAEPSASTIVKKPETLSKTAKIEEKLKFFAQR